MPRSTAVAEDNVRNVVDRLTVVGRRRRRRRRAKPNGAVHARTTGSEKEKKRHSDRLCSFRASPLPFPLASPAQSNFGVTSLAWLAVKPHFQFQGWDGMGGAADGWTDHIPSLGGPRAIETRRPIDWARPRCVGRACLGRARSRTQNTGPGHWRGRGGGALPHQP